MRPVFGKNRLLVMTMLVAALSPSHAATVVAKDGKLGDRKHKDTGRLSAREGRRGSSPRENWLGGIYKTQANHPKTIARRERNLEMRARNAIA